jgi:catechol 2,3-dioxygenase-like lactoylglutathione lyase family enzyme
MKARAREEHPLLYGGCRLQAFVDHAEWADGVPRCRGTCLILVKRDPPINPVLDNHGVHHAFAVAHDEYSAALEHLCAHSVEISFEEDRQGGVLNGPRAYFHDPDGTVLEFIDLTSYAGNPS